jgi:hypothetical protein
MKSQILQAIDEQRKLVFQDVAELQIEGPCLSAHGIYVWTPETLQFHQSLFKEFNGKLTFFIPSSGSGSRMFAFLQQYLRNPSNESLPEIERFFKHLPEFAFYDAISEDWKHQLETSRVDPLAFLTYLMEPEGLNFSNLPKAIFPFHRTSQGIQTPIEGHLRQGDGFEKENIEYHFTIQHGFESLIRETLGSHDSHIQFSYQSLASDAFVFNDSQEAMVDASGALIRRPAGHGALLENLNYLDSDMILVKNIDNIQCHAEQDLSLDIWSGLCGLMLEIQSQFKAVLATKDLGLLEVLNQKYNVFSQSQLEENTSWEALQLLLNRPLRICGMVLNEGQPGGGPFWVNHNGVSTKQIIEKSQLTSSAHFSCLLNSTHFNPVMMVVCTKDLSGETIDLENFVRKDLGIVVQKNHFGEHINYVEKPGLWNGGMYDWNSVFVEIPSAVFSPVKNVMDLLNPVHAGN